MPGLEAIRAVLERPLVEAYGPGSFRIGGVVYSSSVLVLPASVMAWAPVDPAAWTLADLEPVTSLPSGTVDLLIGGLGARMALLPPALRQSLRAAGIAIEPMTTPAACRTFNLLASEGRRVAAALIAMP